MKNPIYANRGSAFEEYIKFSNGVYKNNGIAIIEKQYVEMLPIRDSRGKIVSCKIGEKSSVDYLGRFGHIPIAIEAKNMNSDAIRFDEVQGHQMDFLEDYAKGGMGIGLVLVSFNLQRFFAVPAAFWKAGRDAWKKAQLKGKRKAEQITITKYNQTWTTPGKASVRPEELHPGWEVFTQRGYGLHYLEGAQRYIELTKNL